MTGVLGGIPVIIVAPAFKNVVKDAQLLQCTMGVAMPKIVFDALQPTL